VYVYVFVCVRVCLCYNEGDLSNLRWHNMRVECAHMLCVRVRVRVRVRVCVYVFAT